MGRRGRGVHQEKMKEETMEKRLKRVFEIDKPRKPTMRINSTLVMIAALFVVCYIATLWYFIVIR